MGSKVKQKSSGFNFLDEVLPTSGSKVMPGQSARSKPPVDSAPNPLIRPPSIKSLNTNVKMGAVRPPQSIAKPVQSIAKPVQSIATPSQSIATPKPVQSTVNPIATPSQSIAKPAEATNASRPAISNSTNDNPSDSAEASWTWGSIWQSAAEATAKTMVSAKTMAEQTAQAVTSNEKVKDIYAGVAPNITKLGNDFTLLTSKLAQTIAPPISDDDTREGRMPPFASTLTVWLCATIHSDAKMVGQIHDMVQSTFKELWLKPYPVQEMQFDPSFYICDKLVVNSVDASDGTSTVCGIESAVRQAEQVLEKLNKLAISNEASAASATKKDIFVVIQPFETAIPESQLSPTSTHRQFLCMLVCDTNDAQVGTLVKTTISQSVPLRVSNAEKKWEHILCCRAIETTMIDIGEEVILALGRH